MAMDWYGSHEADLAHQAGSGINTTGAQAGEVGREVKSEADAIIARDEKNAWQEDRTLDRLILALLLVSVFLPLAAAAHRAAGKRASPPWTPSAFAAIAAATTALLVAYRIINQPGDNGSTTVKIGAPLGLVMLAIIAMGAVNAFQGEADFAEMRRAATRPPARPDPADGRADPIDGRRE
jgi:hypothetical protein